MRVPTAVLVFGPPGSGKSTQAGLLADTLALEVVDTGRVLRSMFYDPANAGNESVQAERALLESGKLVTPSFVVETLRQHLANLKESGTSCVLGGSPRTMAEAEGIMPGLVEAYGAGNIFAFLLDVPIDTCRERNVVRALCETCGRAQMATPPATGIPTSCRACGGPVSMRADASAIETRFDEYQNRTVPIFTYLESLGIKLVRIPPALHPGTVHAEILSHLATQLP